MPQADQDKPKILSKNLFPVVGIGASAGGLEAFKKLIKAISPKSGMAYIIVQHLHPDHYSSLPEILQRETTISVNEISDNVEVKPDNIYTIPANKILVATDGILQLSPRLSRDQKNMPIDIFFSSLAEVHQNHAIGIILSGNGEDGTQGLKKIKDHGGITFVQDLGSAANDSMPLSAIDAGVADFILSPEKMPDQLVQLNRTFNYKLPAADGISFVIPDEEIFKRILAYVSTRKGVDFTYYKQTTIHRRILRRQAILKLEKLVDYLDFLKKNKDEGESLFNDLLIPVTSFFRDTQTFESLSKTLFTEITKNKSSINALRIWIAGCSSGEEAYSVGISLYEFLNENASSIKIQIFATDLSEKSIIKARKGFYHKRELAGVSDKRLQLYFTKLDGGYQVKKMIRDMCVFATHNFLKDPPFAKIDLISCRNVLIYMDPLLQKKAFTIFHYALNKKGYLLLGRSETASGSSELFAQADNKEKLYTRKSLTGHFMNVASERREEVIKNNDSMHLDQSRKEDFQKNADDILLAKYIPAAVIVNEHFDIVQFRGSTGPYLEPSPGKASLNVLKMAREGLSFELRNGLIKAKTTQNTFIKEGIPILNGKQLVTIEVVPLLNTDESHFLIIFRDSVIYETNAELAPGTDDASDEKTIRNQKLEKDLMQAREDMSAISEEQEAANDELQAANEELMSGSEELQSLNEELETSKEELQSTNEELITVNQELFDRNEQLNQARLYAEAIITTIHEPLLILTPEFKISSANNSFYKAFSLTEEESTGKVLFELKNNQWDIPELRTKLLRLQAGEVTLLDWEVTCLFPAIGERSICFNAQTIKKENGENWILLALNDITVWKTKEEAKDEFISIASHELRTPLTTAKIYLQLLESEIDKTSVGWKYVQKASTSIERLNALTGELLDVSRIHNGKLELKITNFDFNELTDSAIEEIQVSSPRHVITKTGHLKNNITADKERLKQVILNILSNAVKYSPDADKVSVSVGQADSQVSVSVKDDGIGIKEENLEKIFETYFREEERSKDYSGLGIGLSICHNIIGRHNGKIWAISKEGEGSTFTFKIPLV